MEPRLIDANALLNSIFRITGSFDLSNGRKQNFEAIPTIEIKSAPTIDPVRAAGACYCWECDRATHVHKDDGLEISGYLCNLCDKEMKATDFCSQGKQRTELTNGIEWNMYKAR